MPYLHQKYVQPIEQLRDGSWIVRYGITPFMDGVTFSFSRFPSKPTQRQIDACLHRYALSLEPDERIDFYMSLDKKENEIR